jgi:hypothetical protein
MYALVWSLGQNIWINHRKITVWNRTRKLCIANSVGTDQSYFTCSSGLEIYVYRLSGDRRRGRTHKAGDSFVDDTTTGSTKDDSELEPVFHDISELTSSEGSLIAKMEEIIQFFLDLLQVTGGDLAPKKCMWYLISHRWKDGKPRLLQKKPAILALKLFQDLPTHNLESSARPQTKDIVLWDSL